jgi:type IV pilus assembly protein PilY1
MNPNSMSTHSWISFFARIIVGSCAMLIAKFSFAQLPQVPVYLKEPVPPNVLLTVDNSGSMAWAYVPDVPTWIWANNGGQRFVHPALLAVAQNPLAYDPTKSYPAPRKADGNFFAASFTAAYRYGLLPTTANVTVRTWTIPNPWNAAPTASASATLTNLVNLSTQFQPSLSIGLTNTLSEDVYGTAGAAYYTRLRTVTTASCNPIAVVTPACYENISMTGATADEKQNFANWYSFYRTRHLALKSGMMRAFFDLEQNTRVTWQSLPAVTGAGAIATNRCNFPGVRGGACTSPHRAGVTYNNQLEPLTAAKRQVLFDWLAELETSTSTPLRFAFGDVLTYTQLTGSNNPWGKTPGTLESPINQCRSTFHVAVTDGLWNGGWPLAAGLNIDNAAINLPDGKSYSPIAPYSDTAGERLADLALRAWATDASTAAANTVTPYSVADLPASPATWNAVDYWNPRNDPATWQHVNTFTIGLGLGSFLTNPAWDGSTFASTAVNRGFAPLEAGTTPWPTAGDAGLVYDLWHAAVNGRGDFFSADNPQDIYNAFGSIFGRIAGRSGSAAGSASSSNFIDSDTAIYSASYKTGEWSGEVVRTTVNANGTLGAETKTTDPGKFPLPANRLIITRNLNASAASPNIEFKWANLNDDSKRALTNAAASAAISSLDSTIVDYYRGDRTHEYDFGTCGASPKPACKFRRRGNLLGDILGSGPVYVKAQDFGYRSANWGPNTGSGTAYFDYLKAKKAATGVVLVGANDGMLHGFHPTTLEEQFAYVPTALHSKMWRLTEAAYTKQAFVDGPIGLGDAYIGGAWKTYALVTLGAGGRSVSALDVSPGAAVGPTTLKWEFTHAKLAYLLSRPVITRLSDGSWVAVFSGGYEREETVSPPPAIPSPKKATLFVVNLIDGSLRQEIYFDDLVAADACGVVRTPVNNGLGGVTVARTKSGAIRVYAGDLYGRLWRLENPSGTGTLEVAYSNQPLLKACNAQNVAQPITAAPVVDSLGAEHMVYVGTGKMLVAGDSSNTNKQSFYGVIADSTAPSSVARSVRLGQRTATNFANARTVSSNTINLVNQRGWFIDLPDEGERVTAPASLVDGRVVFATFTPEFTGCLTNGNSWAFNLDALDGAPPTTNLFDINGDQTLSASDKVNGTYAGAMQLTGTITGFTALKRLDRPGSTANAGVTTGTDLCGKGKVKLVANKLYEKGAQGLCTPSTTLRSGWRQLR